MRTVCILTWFAFLVSCGQTSSKLRNANDPGWTLPDTIQATPRRGQPNDDPRRPVKGGLILMGGGADVDAAFVWAHHQIAGDATSRRGDALILRASGSDGYDQYLHELAPFHSVQTLIISPKATREDLAVAARWVERAELVFFAGGNQANYVAWKNSELMRAVQNVWHRGGVIGGTSAGLAIMGQFVFDAKKAGSSNVTTQDAVEQPFSPTISFTRNMLQFPPMHGVITDSHFEERNRLGRLASFMARLLAEGSAPNPITGIGINEGTALLIDARSGIASRAPGSTGTVFIIQGGFALRIVKDQSLIHDKLRVTRLDAAGQTYRFKEACGTGPSYDVTVHGDKPGFYAPADVYSVAAAPGSCL